MVVYVAVDNCGGLMFNNRRQSQDKVLRADILEECKNTILWMNEYSKKQFIQDMNNNIIVDKNFLNKVVSEEACFVENCLLKDYQSKISKIVLYKWNRDYPADFYFDIDLEKWKLISSTDFKGNSHERITKEVWINE